MNHLDIKDVSWIFTGCCANFILTQDFKLIGINDLFEPLLTAMAMPGIIQCASGKDHYLLLAIAGQVLVSGIGATMAAFITDPALAGSNEYGQLGLGHNNRILNHKIIDGFNVIRIAAGDDHSLFMTDDEKVYAFGKNDKGQLGLGIEATTAAFITDPPLAGHFNNVLIPTLVMNL